MRADQGQEQKRLARNFDLNFNFNFMLIVLKNKKQNSPKYLIGVKFKDTNEVELIYFNSPRIAMLLNEVLSDKKNL